MPIYEYLCLTCSTTFEKLQKMNDPTENVPCTVCQSSATTRVVSANSRQSDYWSECTRDSPRNSEATKKLLGK